MAENGSVFDLTSGKLEVARNRVDATMMAVEGSQISEVDQVAAKERMVLASQGIIVVILNLRKQRGGPASAPEVIARGLSPQVLNAEALKCEWSKKSAG